MMFDTICDRGHSGQPDDKYFSLISNLLTYVTCKKCWIIYQVGVWQCRERKLVHQFKLIWKELVTSLHELELVTSFLWQLPTAHEFYYRLLKEKDDSKFLTLHFNDFTCFEVIPNDSGTRNQLFLPWHMLWDTQRLSCGGIHKFSSAII